MKKHVALVAGLAASLLVCAPALSASAAQSADEFEVVSLTLNNGVATDSDDLTGDDNGFLALTGDDLLNTGDDGVGVFSGLSSLTAGELTSLSVDDGTFLFTDLKTQTAKMFERTFTADYAYSLTGITTIDSSGVPVGETLSLSEDISIDLFNEEIDETLHCIVMGSGYGRVALWDICAGNVYDIDTATGDVTTLTSQAVTSDYATFGPVLDWNETDSSTSSSISSSGIVEYVGGELRFILTGVNDYDNNTPVGVFRYVPSAPVTAPVSVLEFPEENTDLYNFTASTVTNQWCGHTEGDDGLLPEMLDMSEPVFCADASFSVSPAPVPNPDPELAETGVDFSGMGIAGIAALGVVAAGAILLSRRHGVTK